MSLYDDWNNQFSKEHEGTAEAFITQYFKKEKEAYAYILSSKENKINTTVKAFAEKFGMRPMEVAGFVDGINTSLETEIDPASLTEDSELAMNIKWDALYINMHKAKASWLYGLDEWNNIYSEEDRAAMLKEYHKSVQAVSNKVGRNAPCPCGSGKKYKNCCGKNA